MPHRKTIIHTLPWLLLGSLVACTGQTPPAATDAPATAGATTDAESKTAGLDTEALRDAASKALRENRMYAPVGDNAIEYYLALREKLPNDGYVSSALVDLLPYTVTAAENTIAREQFPEANRLIALIERVHPTAPALPRLKKAVSETQAIAARRTEAEAAKAKQDIENRVRLADQQRQAQQTAEAARAAAAQQEASRQEAARAQAAAAATPTTTPAAPIATAPATPARATASNLRPISTPAPRYPPDAMRAGRAGEVLLELTIGTDGTVSNARVLKSEPVRVFDREALNAVRRWKYEPVDNPVVIRRTVAFVPQ